MPRIYPKSYVLCRLLEWDNNLKYYPCSKLETTITPFLHGQHQDLYGQTISYNILAIHLLSCRPCYHGTLNLVIVIIHALASSGIIKQRIIYENLQINIDEVVTAKT